MWAMLDYGRGGPDGEPTQAIILQGGLKSTCQVASGHVRHTEWNAGGLWITGTVAVEARKNKVSRRLEWIECGR